MKAADIVINPPLDGFASLDWRRSEELADDGYRAAEAMKDRLLPLGAWTRRNGPRIRTASQRAPEDRLADAAVRDGGRGGAVGSAPASKRSWRRASGSRSTSTTLEADLDTLAGLDRYETVGWRLDVVDGRPGLRVEARPKAHAPPFLMLGVSLQNTTSDDFSFQLAARYLTFDAVGLRLRAAHRRRRRGAASSRAWSSYRPDRRTRRCSSRGGGRPPADAQLRQRRRGGGALQRGPGRSSGTEVGVNLGRDSDVRFGVSSSDGLNANVETRRPRSAGAARDGDARPSGLALRRPGQPGGAVARRPRRSHGIDHIFNAPDVPPSFRPSSRTTT